MTPARLFESQVRTIAALHDTETRYVVLAYLQRALLFTLLALAIVLCLDVANNYAGVMSENAAASGFDGPSRIAFYMLLRAGYVLPSLLPITALVGVIWAEYSLAVSNERVMIQNSGRSPLRSAYPALIFGLIIGSTQFLAMAYGRPASVEAHTVSNFRYYGPKFQRPVTTDPQWIATEGAIVRARIEIGDVVQLRDVLAYTFDNDGQLSAIVSAEVAAPADTGGKWIFSRGSLWQFPDAWGDTADQSAMRAAPFTSLSATLKLSPLWVENFGISPPLLSQAALTGLASGAEGIPYAFKYQTAFQDRSASIAVCIGMALLGATLSLLMYSPKMSPVQPLKVGALAGVAYIASTVLPMVGTYGESPVVLTAWSIPVLLMVGSVAVLRNHSKRSAVAATRARASAGQLRLQQEPRAYHPLPR